MMRDVKGYEGKYKINESGIIINKNGHVMRTAVSNSGYMRVALEDKNGIHRTNESNSTARYLLTEYISSYFEIYTYEYLKKQGVDPSRLNLAFRLYDLKKCADFLDFESFYMYTYETLGGFNDNNFEYINY